MKAGYSAKVLWCLWNLGKFSQCIFRSTLGRICSCTLKKSWIYQELQITISPWSHDGFKVLLLCFVGFDNINKQHFTWMKFQAPLSFVSPSLPYIVLEDRGAQAPLILAPAEGFQGPSAPFGGLRPLLWGLRPLLEAYGLSQYHQWISQLE